jgi:hypothetical protein
VGNKKFSISIPDKGVSNNDGSTGGAFSNLREFEGILKYSVILSTIFVFFFN